MLKGVMHVKAMEKSKQRQVEGSREEEETM